MIRSVEERKVETGRVVTGTQEHIVLEEGVFDLLDYLVGFETGDPYKRK